MSEKKVLGIITARGGSKGIPRKNIKELGGKPLIAYTIQAVKESKLMTHCIVSTDDEEIAEVCREWGAEVPFMRPAELALDTTKHLPVLQHAVKFMEQKLGMQFDYIVNLQPTSPFRIAEDIDGTIQTLIDTNADSALSMVEVDENHPIKMKKIIDGKILPFSIPEPEGMRRQDFPPAYKRSGAVYVLQRKNLMEKNIQYGENLVAYIVPKERSIDIDDELDWIKAEYMIKKLRENGYPY